MRKSEEKKQTVRTQEKSRGRFEVRTLTTTTNLIDDGYLKWPGVKQLIRLERRTVENGAVRESVTYGITSLSRNQADAAMLLRCLRGRWHIENRCFYVLDTRLAEDASRIRTGRSACGQRHPPRRNQSGPAPGPSRRRTLRATRR